MGQVFCRNYYCLRGYWISLHCVAREKQKREVMTAVLILSIIFNYSFFMGVGTFKGRFEALLWHCNVHAGDVLNKDYHPEFAAERSVLFMASFSPIAVMVLAFVHAYYWVLLFFPLALFFSYPFFHNGAKYAMRNNLSPRLYPERWKSEPSKTSIARMNLSWKQRQYSFYLGILFLILSIISAW